MAWKQGLFLTTNTNLDDLNTSFSEKEDGVLTQALTKPDARSVSTRLI